MLHVWRASGEEVASRPKGEISNVRALKLWLQKLTGYGRFRQRLLVDVVSLEDEAELKEISGGKFR